MLTLPPRPPPRAAALSRERHIRRPRSAHRRPSPRRPPHARACPDAVPAARPSAATSGRPIRHRDLDRARRGALHSITIAAPGACRIALLSASCTMRYAASPARLPRSSVRSTCHVNVMAAPNAARRDEFWDVREAGLRREFSLGVLGAQHAEQPPHFDERVAGLGGDVVELRDERRRHVGCRYGGLEALHVDDRHAVSDDVVQLARDAGLLLGDDPVLVLLGRDAAPARAGHARCATRAPPYP